MLQDLVDLVTVVLQLLIVLIQLLNGSVLELITIMDLSMVLVAKLSQHSASFIVTSESLEGSFSAVLIEHDYRTLEFGLKMLNLLHLGFILGQLLKLGGVGMLLLSS